MRVCEIMSRDVEWIDSDATVQEAFEKLKDIDSGPLLICENDRIIGTINEREIAIRASVDGRGPMVTPLREVMTPGIRYCFDYEPVGDAATYMEDLHVNRLVVIDSTRTMVGTVSLDDVTNVTDIDHDVPNA